MKKTILLLGGVLLLFVAVAFFLLSSAKNNPKALGEETALDRFAYAIAYATVSELKTEAEYKRVWEEASKKMSEQESFELILDFSEQQGLGRTVVKISGEDMSMISETQEEGRNIKMTTVKKGEEIYFGLDDKGFKTTSDTELAEDLGVDLFDFEEDLEEWDPEGMKYLGLESLNGRKFHTYYSEQEGTTTWIDALAILSVYFEEDDGSKGTMSYVSVEIEAPEGYEDISNLSEEEQGAKFFELYFSGWDFDDDIDTDDFVGFDEEWDLE